uniref:Ubiquitin-like domain-containing protein n=1 Tax=Parascaris univalens TaxID=6257 RepID=A0A915A3U6_PARUN
MPGRCPQLFISVKTVLLKAPIFITVTTNTSTNTTIDICIGRYADTAINAGFYHSDLINGSRNCAFDDGRHEINSCKRSGRPTRAISRWS